VEATRTFKSLLDLLEPYRRGAPHPPPAATHELQELDNYVRGRYPGAIVPPALESAWKLRDGDPLLPGRPVPQCLFYSYLLMPVRLVIDECQAIDRIVALPESFPSEPLPSYPEGAVRGDVYSRAWLPFAHDGCGGALAIDAAPGPAGTVGQVINYGRGDMAHFQLGTTFEAFLERVMDDYRHMRFHRAFGDEMLYVDRLLQSHQSPSGRVQI
jgi:hypothetical protein